MISLKHQGSIQEKAVCGNDGACQTYQTLCSAWNQAAD